MRKLSPRQVELLVLCLLSFAAFVLFWNSDLDLWAAKLFYHSEKIGDTWFEQDNKLWIFFYFAAPWLTGILLFGSLAVLVLAQFRDHLKAYRIYAVYVFMVIALGPGLFVNGIFKPYWGRPRPREVIELGGKQTYRPFYVPAVGAPGKSFPCGHCSVGFSYGLLWWLLRRKKPLIAGVSLLGSLGIGTLMGIGRIAAGGHFFSDVVWAGLITYWVSYWVYYSVLKVPERELGHLKTQDSLSRIGNFLLQNRSLNAVVYSSLAMLTVLILLLASPFHQEVELTSKESQIADLEIQIDHARVDLKLDINQASPFNIKGFVKGFGFPGNRVLSTCEASSAGHYCRVTRRGFFSDYESVMEVSVNPQLVQKLHLILKKGEFFRDEGSDLPATYRVDLKK